MSLLKPHLAPWSALWLMLHSTSIFGLVEIEISPGEKVEQVCARLTTVRAGLCAEFKERLVHSKFERRPLFAQTSAARRPGSLEGLLAPGLYALKPEAIDTFIDLLYESSSRHVEFLETQLRTDDRLTAYELLTLASIVQKESVSGANLERVAAVFRNRLDKEMKLESCPSVEFALGFHRPFLYWKDLKIDSPYNTYLHRGLPPTPIATVSREAIQAAAGAADSEAIFLVFDWTTQTHAFTADLTKHQQNAARARENFVRIFGEKMMRKAFSQLYYEPFPATSSSR